MPKSKAQMRTDAAVLALVTDAISAMRESLRFGVPSTKEKRAYARGGLAAYVRALSLITGESPEFWQRRIEIGANAPH